MKQGDLVVVGTGIRIADHLTPEAARHIEAADHLLYLVGPHDEEGIGQLNPNHESVPETRLCSDAVVPMSWFNLAAAYNLLNIKYIKKRKTRDPKFAENFDSGYEQFKIGAILKQAREEAGLTQEELAAKLNTKKSAISRIENHAEDIKLSTLERFANALGKELRLEVT